MDEQRAWLKSRRRKRLRLLSAVLCVALLATMHPEVLRTLTAFAVEMWGGGDTLSVTRFVDLPDEVREQTVPVGTDISELELPDTLEAYVRVETGAGTEDDAKPGEEDEDNDGGPTGEGDENSDGGPTGEGDENSDGGPGGEGDENSDGGEGDEDSDGGPTDEGDEDSDGGPTDEGDEDSDGGPAGEGDENSDGGSAGEGDEDSDGGPTGEGDGNSDGGPTDEGDGNSDGGPTGEGDGNSDGETSEDGDSNGGGEGDDHEEASGGNDESSAEESNEDTRSTDVPEESDSADNRKTAGFHVQTGFFVMPVYASENTGDAQPVETLTAAPAGSTDTTDEPAGSTDTTDEPAGSTDTTDAPAGSTDTTDAPADRADTTDAPEDGTDTDAAQENRVVIEGVTWESDPAYDKDTRGVYTFTPVLPEGCVLSEGVSLPRITVTVGNVMDAVIQELLDRIAALPDAREYMEKEPDIDDWEEDEDAYEEAYEEWMEKLYDYAEEALSIQEEIEGLTQEEQALIPQEALEKLAAWVEIAEQAAESRMVMAVDDHYHFDGSGPFTAWTSTTSLPTKGDYYLTDDVVLSETKNAVISDSYRPLNLCLNEHSIEGKNRSSAIFSVKGGGKLNIYECIRGGSVDCVPADASIPAVAVSDGGTFVLNGGSVGGDGGPAAVITESGGSITVKGGSVSAIDADGIEVRGGTLEISGGSIGAERGNAILLQEAGTVKVTGSATLYGGPIYITCKNPIIASGNGVSGLTTTYNIQYSDGNVSKDQVVVQGSTDKAHYKLISDTYGLAAVGGNLVAKEKYTVTYNENGGTIANKSSYTSYIHTVGLKLPEPTRTGYTFGGWYTDSACTGKPVTDITTTDTGAKTYYAKWTADTYTVTYNKNSGTIKNESNYTSYTYGAGLKLPEPTRAGYTFGGWYKNSGLTGTAVTSITTIDTGAKTYYAKWTANTYTITYDGNGSTGGSTADSVHTYDTAKNLTANGYEKKYTVTFSHNYAGINNKTETAAYMFDGWNTKADGSGTAYKDNSSVTNLTAINGETLTLYARWSPASPVSISYMPTRTNYTFAGWYADKDCSGSRVDSDGTYIPTASVTLYAKWAGEGHRVVLHGNGGTGTDLTTYTHGTDTPLPTDWTRSGYTFKGWYENAQCEGEAVTKILDDAVGDKEYWAKWTDDTAPVIGNLEYSYAPKTLWQWLIGKESLRITVPVTEEGSGADVIKYTVTPDGGSPEQKTAPVLGGKAVITVDADFKGTISIACTDRDGNKSADVTVGADMGAAGVMIEDHAPRIELKTVGAEPLRTGEYETLPDISVTVTDDKDNAISSGLASVSCQIGDRNKPVGNASDYTATIVVNKSFTIGADELSGPETVVTVTAADHAGNSSTVSKTIKIHTHSGTVVPAKAATCTEDGNLAHYGCTCGKLFSDSACTVEITDHASVILARLEHVYEGDYQYDAEGHWKVCSRCKTADTKQSHNYDNDKDALCNDCGYKRTIKKPDTGKDDEEKPKPEQPTTPDGTNPSEQPTTPGGTNPSEQPTTPGGTNPSEQPTTPGGTNPSEQPTTPGGTNPSEQPTTPGQDHSPKQPTAPDQTHSSRQPTAQTPVDTRRQPQEAEGQDSRPADKQELESAGKSELAGKTSEAQAGQLSESDRVQIVPAFIDNGKLTISESGDLVATGNVEGTTATSTVFEVENGAVIVKVVCDKQECTASVADTIAVANAVLTKENLAYVDNGGQVEIRIDIKDISDHVPAQDRETIERGIEEYQKDAPGLTQGTYLDISIFMKSGDGDWNPVTETEEAVEVVIGIPEHMQRKDRAYVIIRVHDGEHTLLNDLDDAPDTITIHTERFSSYAIAYVEGAEVGTGGMPKCQLCHICRPFLGICCFIWLEVIATVIAAVILIVILVLRGKKRQQAFGQ